MSCIPHLTELAAIEREFAAMTDRLKPLTINGVDLGHGFPAAPVPLTELRARLLDRGTPDQLKQSIWSVLVRNAQTVGPEWTVAAAAMMSTALRTAVFRASRPCPQLRNDLESEVVAGFLHALLHTDPAALRLASRLWWAAYSAGLKARRRELDASCHPLPEVTPSHPAAAGGHPDVVLAKAVTANVISHTDAELISATRIQREPLRSAARRHGLTYAAGKLRRWRAESRVLAYLGHRCLIGLHPDTPATAAAPA